MAILDFIKRQMALQTAQSARIAKLAADGHASRAAADAEAQVVADMQRTLFELQWSSIAQTSAAGPRIKARCFSTTARMPPSPPAGWTTPGSTSPRGSSRPVPASVARSIAAWQRTRT